MSGWPDDDAPSPRSPGRRKDGQPYKDGNTGEDGSYLVGRNRTPVHSRFQIGDGRTRGRRAKGVPNADTEFERELNRKIVLREDGKERKVSKSLGVDLRLIDNATRKGDNRAIDMVDQRRRRIAAEKEETAKRYHALSSHEMLDQYLRERAAELQLDASQFGDPPPDRGPDRELDNG